jgi:enoyl-CoA hydratase
MRYDTLLLDHAAAVTVVRLNRPQALNALNSQVLQELGEVFSEYERDNSKHCLVLTGSEKAFAAGADIKEMQPKGVW